LLNKLPYPSWTTSWKTVYSKGYPRFERLSLIRKTDKQLQKCFKNNFLVYCLKEELKEIFLIQSKLELKNYQ
jgi:hypothetical protein